MLVSKCLIIEIIFGLKLSLLDFIKLANMQRCTLVNPHVPYTAEYNPQEYKTSTPTFDPKILEKMDFVSIDRTPNSAF